MRSLSLSFGLGLVVMLAGCGGGDSGPGAQSCAPGQVLCGSTCVASGTCNQATGGSDTSGTGGSGTGGTSAGAASSTGGTTDPNPGACTDVSANSGTLAQQYAATSLFTSDNKKSYILTSNWWHVYNSQSISFNGLSFTINDPNNVSVPSSDGAPTGFPAFFIGSYSGSTTLGSNLPKQVSALTQVPTVFSTDSLNHDTSNFNAAYDVWFTATSATLPANQSSPGAGGAFLMVWLFDPSGRQPRGSNRHPAQTVSGVDGTWDVWADNANPICISYVSTSRRNELTFDLNNFIKHAVTNNYGITNSMYLSVIFAGFEVWGGGNGLQATKFCAKVN